MAAHVSFARSAFAHEPSAFARMVPPPGIDMLREQIYRLRYQRERACSVDVDGVTWPVDLGEAGA